jgi:arylsulfatase A-like enzyme
MLSDLWRELAPDDNGLFVFTADHGEEMVEHGWLGHSQSLYEELARVPLFFWWPRGIPGGLRISQPVSTLDIVPTLLDLLGAEPPPGFAGRSLTPFWRNPQSPGGGVESRPVFLELAPPKPFRWAVVDGDRKLIIDPARPELPELYDLASDPGETSNLAASLPAEVERLRAELRSWARRNPRAPDQRTRDRVDEDLRKELEALGYLGSSTPSAPTGPKGPAAPASSGPPPP